MNIPPALTLKPSTPASRAESAADLPTDELEHTFENVFDQDSALPEGETALLIAEPMYSSQDTEDIDPKEVENDPHLYTPDVKLDDEAVPVPASEPDEAEPLRETPAGDAKNKEYDPRKEPSSLPAAEGKSVLEQMLTPRATDVPAREREQSDTPPKLAHTDPAPRQPKIPVGLASQLVTDADPKPAANANSVDGLPIRHGIAIAPTEPLQPLHRHSAPAEARLDSDLPTLKNPEAAQFPDQRMVEPQLGVRNPAPLRPAQPNRSELMRTPQHPLLPNVDKAEPGTPTAPNTKLELSWPPAAAPTAPQLPTAAMQTTVLAAHAQAFTTTRSMPAITAAALTDNDALFELSGSGTLAEPRIDAPRSITAATPTFGPRAELPAGIARQIMDVMQRAPDRSVEVALNPAELGRVRLTLAPADLGITVTIVAERPETLDLMRRNIDQLANAMDGLGYEDVAFTFGQGQSGTFSDQSGAQRDQAQFGPEARPGTIALHHDIRDSAENTPNSPLQPARQAGLDLRL